jgi:autotransporter-associated beta strand protein
MRSTIGYCLSLAALSLVAGSVSGQPYNWTATGTANWSVAGNWNANGNPNPPPPDGVGVAIQNIQTLTATETLSVDIPARTVGSIMYGSSSNNIWTISTTNAGVTLNQDGAGAGIAQIVNSNTNSGSTNRLLFTGTTNGITLADDLLLSNTGNSTSSSGAIDLQCIVKGNGNLTISNVSTALVGAGSVRLEGVTNTFVGSVLVQKGTTTCNFAQSYGNASNVITLGQSGQGDAAILSTAGLTMPYNIIVASGSGGTLTLGSLSTATNTFSSGPITLNGNVSLLSSGTTNFMTVSSNISGAGAITTNGLVILTNIGNSYGGGTTIASGTLKVNNASGSGTGTGPVTASGGALGGTGSIAGAVTIANGGKLAPGNSIGTLNVAGMTWQSGGSYSVEHDPSSTTSDLVNGSGTLDLSALTTAPFTLNLISTAGTGGTQRTYTIATFASGIFGKGGNPLTPFVNGDDVSALFTPTGQFASLGSPFATIFNNGGSSQSIQITFTPVPEPGLVLLACGAGTAGWWARRRRAAKAE